MATANSHDALSFFILEASECLERLDTALSRAGAGGPASDEFVGAARTLRGSATMHRVAGMAELAQCVERAGRALRDKSVSWTPSLASGMVAAVDDLKILLHSVRSWGASEDARVAKRRADLARMVPGIAEATPTTPATPAAAGRDGPGSLVYVATAVGEIADALDAFVASPGTRESLSAALSRLRSVRGVAAINDHPPLGEVLDAVERVGRRLDVPSPGPDIPESQLALLRTAAAVLRHPAPDTPELAAFRVARADDALGAADADRIVPISELGYGDAADVVRAVPNPPTTCAERFRLEAVSQAEHLLLLVAEARDATETGEPAATLVGEVRSALRAVRNAALSFGQRDLADLLGTFADEHHSLDFLALNSIEDVARLLADPSPAGAPDLSQRISALSRGRSVDAGIGQALAAAPAGASAAAIRAAAPAPSAPARSAPAHAPPTPTAPRPAAPRPVTPRPATPRPATPKPATPSRVAPRIVPRAVPASHAGEPSRARTPTGPELHALLADGLSGLSPLTELPFGDVAPLTSPTQPQHAERLREPSAPAAEARVPVDRDGLVLIDALLYRGSAALARARTLRDAIKGTRPSQDVLDELLDLIDLAASPA